MKNFVSLFAVLFLFALTSCSDVNDNSFLTNPVMEKTTSSDSGIETSPDYPYPYLFNFNEIKELKFASIEGENSIEFYIPENSPKYDHLFVVAHYVQDLEPKMFYIDDIYDYTFKVEGLVLNQLRIISVYGLEANSTESNVVYPFTNNSFMNEVAINNWKTDNREIAIECEGIWASSLKYIFAELDTKHGSFLVFLQRPYSTNFVIPEYGKYGVEGVKLFGYQTVMEAKIAKN